MSESAVRAYAEAKRFGAVTLERWLRRAPADQADLLGVAERLRLGENHVRDLLDALEAIALRRGCGFADILSVGTVKDVLTGGRARNETLHALKHALRRLRYPELTATETRLRALANALGLPKGVTVTLPENLEGDEIIVSVRARSAEELRRHMASTVAVLSGDGLDEMYRVLGGEWVIRWRPDEVWIEGSERMSTLAQTVLTRVDASRVHVFDGPWRGDARDFAAGKRRLVLQRQRGGFLEACPAGTTGLVCCSYLVVNFGSNCPFDCSYCFLQEYLAQNATMRAFTNVEDGLAEIDAVLRAHPERSFRIGTGELADSLALDPITGLAPRLVRFFAEHANAVLELKTKSDCVDELLGIDPRERTVVSWSVNASEVIDSEEHGTASLSERIAAAQRVERAGYRLGFHFDPLIEFDGWERAYDRAIAAIFSAVDVRRVAWVSVGSLRLTPGLAATVRARRDARYAATSELVPGRDGKARVWRGLRLRMYRTVLQSLARVAGPVTTYLCMEPPAVWEQVMREVPSDRHLGMRLSAPAPW